MTRIRGTPRKKSTYPVVRTLIGNSAGAVDCLMSARPSASSRIRTSATRNILMLSQIAAPTE